MAKKVLIITYYWPPAGGPGVQRWLKFVKYLPEHDIEPIVYVPENPSYPLRDENLSADIPEGIKVVKRPIKEPYRLARMFSKDVDTISKGIIPETRKQGLLQRLMLYIRGNFYIPDARKAWIKPSVRFLGGFLEEQGIDTVITTGPPHSLHLIGLKLKELKAINWIADFRDPWTSIGYHDQLKLTAASRRKHEAFEHDVLNRADRIIVTSFNLSKDYQRITNQPITVITNGYDTEKIAHQQPDTYFSISHIGSMLSGRNPQNLWQVLSELIRDLPELGQSLRINLVGAVSDAVVDSLKANGLDKHLHLVGYVDHAEVMKYQRRSQVLLLVEIDSEATKCIIPGKLFEYMAAHRPIIAIGPQGSDIETLLRATNTGSYYEYSATDELKDVILSYFKAFQDQNLRSHPVGIQQYHRRALTGKLAELIKAL